MNEQKKNLFSIIDTHQSSWQLAAIQLSGWISIPTITTSLLVLQRNSFLGTILTIIVGNAILWFLRLGIIAMSHEKRLSTLDLSQEYLGDYGKWFIAVLLLTSTLAWFITQTTTVSNTLTNLIKIQENPEINQQTQISIFIGVISSILCMEGMSLLKKLSIIAFPVITLLFVFIIIFLPIPSFKMEDLTLSFSGLGLILTTNLGITSDLPTFFRHSRSWSDTVKALTIVQTASLGLGLLSLWFFGILTPAFSLNQQLIVNEGGLPLVYSLAAFAFFSGICANVANVYSASVGWELIAPKLLLGRQEYLILGLGLSTIFILVSNLFSVDFLLNLSESSLANLSIILTTSFLLNKLSNRNREKRKSINFIAWLLSTAVNGIQLMRISFENYSTLALACSIIFTILATYELTAKKRT